MGLVKTIYVETIQGALLASESALQLEFEVHIVKWSKGKYRVQIYNPKFKEESV